MTTLSFEAHGRSCVSRVLTTLCYTDDAVSIYGTRHVRIMFPEAFVRSDVQLPYCREAFSRQFSSWLRPFTVPHNQFTSSFSACRLHGSHINYPHVARKEWSIPPTCMCDWLKPEFRTDRKLWTIAGGRKGSNTSGGFSILKLGGWTAANSSPILLMPLLAALSLHSSPLPSVPFY